MAYRVRTHTVAGEKKPGEFLYIASKERAFLAGDVFAERWLAHLPAAELQLLIDAGVIERTDERPTTRGRTMQEINERKRFSDRKSPPVSIPALPEDDAAEDGGDA